MMLTITYLSAALVLSACGGKGTDLITKAAGGSPTLRNKSPQVARDEALPTPPRAMPHPANDQAPTMTPPRGPTSYTPVDSPEAFATMRERLGGEREAFAQRQQATLRERYDLSDQSNPSITTFRGKGVQKGVRVRLRSGLSWTDLNQLTVSKIKEDELFPAGFLPLPHPKHREGGQVFPKSQIDEIKKQEGRDLQRFDVDLDLPSHFLPDYPPPMFLISRPDLGDVSQGQLVTSKNFFQLFNGILTPKQLDGLRLLVTPFAQQQFNLTDDRRVETPQLGVTCFDCHANGSTNGATHLDPTTRPQASRRRLDTPSLRGLNIQRLFGSQRALKTVEDFTQFEQIGAYFDGDPLQAIKKGANPLDRILQVNPMAEFQELLDFTPAPKLDPIDGKLITGLATPQELHGQEVFFGKGRCAECHVPPYYTDNTMHDLKTERFYKPLTVNDEYASGDGSIKTFPLRGIKETPPYLHDGRLLTLADTVEFFNLVLQTKLTEQDKADLVVFMETL